MIASFFMQWVSSRNRRVRYHSIAARAAKANRKRSKPMDLIDSAPAERNKGPILEVLVRHLPASGTVLEIASGTGQHAVHFAAALPDLVWQPSDVDPAALPAIEARRERAGLANVLPPLALDVREQPWPIERADAMVCCNMIHIAPWQAALGLLAGAQAVLGAPEAPLCLYGPYRRGGRHTAPSNAAFDASLRQRNPEWGVRDLEEVVAVAERQGFRLADLVPMPANNFTLVLRRVGGG
jgi:hypothetical protein